jgi:hypothetical protein
MVTTGSGETTCPECGESMPLVTYVGEQPSCPRCAGMTTTGLPEREGMDFEETDCLHELLERSRPPNQKGKAHMLACPCPKCSVRC